MATAGRPATCKRRDEAKQQPPNDTGTRLLLSNLGSAAGVGAESAAHPLAAEAWRRLDVSVEKDELQLRVSTLG